MAGTTTAPTWTPANEASAHHREKVPADDPRYQTLVAKPVMGAVDQMPKDYRALVHEFGYVDVYRAWKRGMTPAEIRERAQVAGGRFVL